MLMWADFIMICTWLLKIKKLQLSTSIQFPEGHRISNMVMLLACSSLCNTQQNIRVLHNTLYDYSVFHQQSQVCMNNTAENDLFGFPGVKWLHLTGEVGKYVRCSCQIFSGFNTPKLLISVNFWQSYSKNKKVDVFWNTMYIRTSYRCQRADDEYTSRVIQRRDQVTTTTSHHISWRFAWSSYRRRLLSSSGCNRTYRNGLAYRTVLTVILKNCLLCFSLFWFHVLFL